VRVLQIGKYYHPRVGGIERVLQHLNAYLRDRVDVQVLCFHDRPESCTEVVDGVVVHRMARWESLFSVPIAPGMYWWLREHRFDLVHLHVPNPLAELLYLLAPRGPEKLVIGYHAEPQKASGLRRLYSPVAHRILERADAIAVASPHHRGPGTALDAHDDRVEVIPFGIDVERYAAPPGEDRAAAAWRERMGGPFALFVGRLVPYKGLIPLLEAVRRSGVRLAVVGSGPLFANLQQLRAGQEERVQLLGEVSDEELPALLRAARFLVLPSMDASEAFGMVQLEAFAAGTPVLASDLPTGVSWVSQHERTGLLVPPGDVDAWTEALRRGFDDDDVVEGWSRAALARAREEFEAETFGARTLALYRRLLGVEEDEEADTA
jgi:rhamnosyl/mannosyltransferase